MAESSKSYIWGTRHLLLGAAIVAAILIVGITVWPIAAPNPIGTPKGGANPATAPDTTNGRGAPAQRSAESTVGKNSSKNGSAGNDANGGRAKDIKQSSQVLQLNPRQQQQIKDAIARQTDAPKVAKAPFEMMIGTAVPRQVPLKNLPPEITQAMNGFQGDQYVLVQDEMVIVDHDSRRVVAIVPTVG